MCRPEAYQPVRDLMTTVYPQRYPEYGLCHAMLYKQQEAGAHCNSVIGGMCPKHLSLLGPLLLSTIEQYALWLSTGSSEGGFHAGSKKIRTLYREIMLATEQRRDLKLKIWV